jgi:peptidyl-dipeptidase Dcp
MGIMNRLFKMSCLIFSASLPVCGSSFAQVNIGQQTNPFFTVSILPFQAPPFDKIKEADLKPALEEGMKVQLAEIQKIINNPAAPTFDNTLVAMEKSGRLLNRVYRVFILYTNANTNPELQKIEREEAPRLTAHTDAIYLDKKLFERIELVYKSRSTLGLNAESIRLIEYMYQQFLMAGARLSEADKIKLKVLNEEEASLKVKFTSQLLAATKAGALLLSDSSELSGLSSASLDAFAQIAKTNSHPGKWMIPLQNTTQQPSLQSLTNRATRQALFEESWNRTEKNDSNDTRAIIIRLARIRIEKAQLLGFANYASWKLQDQMAKTPAAVETFFARLSPPAIIKVKDEADLIQTQINKQNKYIRLEPWDWSYYAEQIRKEKYKIDESEVKPYFELNNVLENGVFYAANQLYGISFKERHDLPVYQKDVRVFDVFDNNSKPFALFYCDYFKRDNKAGGAWCSNLVSPSLLWGTKPVIYNVANFTQPAPGQPALISFEDVTTMFHEFGHALHAMFYNLTYPSLSAAKVARDFVEFPSQFNEHWALDPIIFKHYAIHYKTGDPMPDELVVKIRNAAAFDQGYKLMEVLSASVLDMQWHTLSPNDSLQDADKFEIAALHKSNLDLHEVPSRYRSSYFLHIWSNGYASGYYAYMWTKMLAEDMFSWFEENGGLTRENGQRFRDMILSRGITEDYGKMFFQFRGHDPEIKPMLKAYGLPVQ